MSESSFARRTFLNVDYNNKNITKELEKHLVDWTYTDNLSGEIDDFNITLEDHEALWTGSWFPSKGSLLVPTLIKSYWEDKAIKTKLGKFEIDEIDGSGPSSVISIKALAVSESSSLRGEEKSKAWEKATLKTVVSEIAKRNKMKLYWQTSENPKKDRFEQESETDLRFLHRLCKDEGLCLKIANNTIIVLDEADYEAKPIVDTIRRISKASDKIQVVNWSFRTTVYGTYKACRVTYRNVSKKKTISAIFTAPKAPKVGRILVIKQEVSSQKEALSLAKKKLREANKNGTTVTLTVVTTRHIDAGMTFNLADFGKLNGKYIVTRVVHKPFSVKLELRRCLEGY